MDKKDGNRLEKKQEETKFQNEIAEMVNHAEKLAREYNLSLKKAVKKGVIDVECVYPSVIMIYQQVKQKVNEKGWKDQVAIYDNQIRLYQEQLEKDKKLREIESQKLQMQKEFYESQKFSKEAKGELLRLKTQALEVKKRSTLEYESKKDQAFNFMDLARKELKQNSFDKAVSYYKESEKIFAEIKWPEGIRMINESINVIKIRKERIEREAKFNYPYQKVKKTPKTETNGIRAKLGNKERILDLLKKNALTSKEIANELNLSEKNTRTYLTRLKKEDKITDIGKTGRFLIYTHKEALTPRNQHDEIVALEGDLSYLLSLIELKMTPKDGVKFTPTDLMKIRRIEERIADKIGGNLKAREVIKDLIDFEQSFKKEINEKIAILEEKVDFITSHKVSYPKNLVISDDQISGNKLPKNQETNGRFQIAEEYDYFFKSIVVGDGGVGKTALTLWFSKGFFTEDFKLTIGVDFHVKIISIDTSEGPIKCKLQLWDTGGQERFSSIRPMYYRNALGVILVFDLTNYASFEHLPQWIEEVRASIKEEIPVLLVGNKSDLIDQRVVSIEEISKFTKDFNLYYMETSAKTGDGVRDCFYILAFLMIGQGIPEHLIESANIYAPGEIHKRGSQFSTSVTRINEPQVEYSAPLVPKSITDYESPFRVIKREELPKPQPTFGIIGVSSIPRREFSDRSPIFQTVKPTVSSSDSLIDYMPQTIITKKEKKKIAKEKKKQDKEKAKIEKEKKILESRERGSLFQTLAQKTEALTASQSVPFIPFTGESKTKEEGKSKLRIIPNVADIEADSSTFTAFTPTQPIQEEKPKSRSSDLLVCEQCGTILSSDYAFCNKCGNKL